MKDEKSKVRKNDLKIDKIVRYVKNFLIVLSYVIIAMVFMSEVVLADDPAYSDIFNQADVMFSYVQGKLFQLSGGAVIIAVGIGIFMKKFSMGKQDKIETGNKIIRDSLVGFLFLNSMPVVVKTMKGLIDGTIMK